MQGSSSCTWGHMHFSCAICCHGRTRWRQQACKQVTPLPSPRDQDRRTLCRLAWRARLGFSRAVALPDQALGAISQQGSHAAKCCSRFHLSPCDLCAAETLRPHLSGPGFVCISLTHFHVPVARQGQGLQYLQSAAFIASFFSKQAHAWCSMGLPWCTSILQFCQRQAQPWEPWLLLYTLGCGAFVHKRALHSSNNDSSSLMFSHPGCCTFYDFEFSEMRCCQGHACLPLCRPVLHWQAFQACCSSGSLPALCLPCVLVRCPLHLRF